MSKKRVSKVSKRRLAIFAPICILSIISFSFTLIYNLYTLYDLSSQKKVLDERYLELQEKAEELKIDIEKLNDPEYLANYAREHYLYSKDGEYIIQIEEINETNTTLKNLNIQIDNVYIIIFLSILMIFILLYILFKGKKKNKYKTKK